PAPPTSAQIAKMYSSEGLANLEALSGLVKDNDADLVVGAAALLFDGGRKREGASLLKWAAHYRCWRASSSSGVRGQSWRSKRESARSAKRRPPVWQAGQ